MEDENDESFFNLLIPNIYDVSEENELEVLVLSTMSTIRWKPAVNLGYQ